MPKLTPKQRRFVKEYLVDMNAKQAAIRAGYSKATAEQQGSRLLRNAQVQAFVKEAQKALEEKTELSAEWVLKNLREVAERCMQRAPVMVRQGNGVVHVTDEKGRHIWEFDSAGANRSLELIGKHFAMFTDKADMTFRAPEPIAFVPAKKRRNA